MLLDHGLWPETTSSPWFWPVVGSLYAVAALLFAAGLPMTLARRDALLRGGADVDQWRASLPVRLLYMLGCQVAMLEFNLAGLRYGLVPGTIMAVGALMVTHSLDQFAAGHLASNLAMAARNGYSAGRVALYAAFNIVSFTASQSMVMLLALGERARGAHPHSSLWLVPAVLLSLAMAEACFYPVHKLMHRHPALARLHLLHHCCTRVTKFLKKDKDKNKNKWYK
jgi:hypothetical protein